MTSFLDELKRRKVFRVAALYVVGAWVIIQVAGEAFDAWEIPESALRYIWLAAILGTPLALLLGWRYDIAGGRIVRTPAADETAVVNTPLQRTDYALFVALVAVMGMIVVGLTRQTVEPTPPLGDATAILPKSIAVLPFDNLSGDDDAMPFTVGIHDDILTHISKISDLKVISRTSVIRLDPTMSIREIGDLLNVGTVLEGGVQVAGNQLRINVQLIDASTDVHLWAETFTKELSTQEIFAIQSEIAQAVAIALQATLSSREQQNLEKIPTTNFAAYEAYLFGKQRMATRTIPSLEQAQDYFTTAVNLDTEFAMAHVALADTILLLSNYGAIPLDEAVPQADVLLDRAIELDPNLGAVFATIGLSLSRQNRSEEAIVEFEKAIELDPNYAPTYNWFADVLINRLGDFNAALPLLEKARSLDPLSPVINDTLGEAYAGLGQFDLALAQFEKAVAIDADYANAYFDIALLQRFAFGRADEGVRWHIEAIERDAAGQETSVGLALLDLDDNARAAYWIDKAYSDNPDTFWSVGGKVLKHLHSGDIDAALLYAHEMEKIAPGNNFIVFALLVAGDDEKILDMFNRFFPDFDCNSPAVDINWMSQAINVSLAMERSGDADCGRRVLAAALEVVQTMPRFGNLGHGIADVEIYARQGRTELALATLREAIDAGWISGWWIQGVLSPHNANIANEPEFIAMMDEVREKVAIQHENVLRMEANGEFDLPLPPQ